MAKTIYLRADDMKIVLTDSLITAILVGLFLDATNVMPTAICFILAALAAIGMAVLFFTKVGFWIIAVVYSLFWGVFWALIAGALSEDNAILEWLVGIIACACSVFFALDGETLSQDSDRAKDKITLRKRVKQAVLSMVIR